MATKNRSGSRLVIQGSILAIASLVVRLIGFAYRIPLTNMLGEDGMAYYGAAFSIYSFILVISTYALPAALSKLISKKMTLKKYKEAHQIFRSALLLAVIVGVITSLLMFTQADLIAGVIEGKESVKGSGVALSLRVLAPALLIFSILAVFRGYFQGMNTMVPTGISQVIEQIFNAIASLVCASILLKTTLAAGASGGNMGAGIGAFFALMFLVVIYFMARPRLLKRMERDTASISGAYGLLDTWKIILMTVVPMMLGTTAFQLANLSDTLLFQGALLSHGLDGEFVRSQFGILTSKYSLLIMLPVSIATALSTASIPSISKSLAQKDYAAIKNKTKVAIRVVMIISIPAAFGLGFLAKPILLMLFPNTSSIDATSLLLQLGAVSVVAYSVSSISIAILQGINKIYVPVKNALFAVVVKVGMTFLLLYVFNFGLMGAVVNSIIFSLIVGSLNYHRMMKEVRVKIDYKVTVLIPMVAGLVMGIVALLAHMMIDAATGSNTIATLVAIVLAVVIYFIVIFVLGGMNEELLKSLPMGNKLIKIGKRFNWV